MRGSFLGTFEFQGLVTMLRYLNSLGYLFLNVNIVRWAYDLNDLLLTILLLENIHLIFSVNINKNYKFGLSQIFAM